MQEPLRPQSTTHSQHGHVDTRILKTKMYCVKIEAKHKNETPWHVTSEKLRTRYERMEKHKHENDNLTSASKHLAVRSNVAERKALSADSRHKRPAVGVVNDLPHDVSIPHRRRIKLVSFVIEIRARKDKHVLIKLHVW